MKKLVISVATLGMAFGLSSAVETGHAQEAEAVEVAEAVAAAEVVDVVEAVEVAEAASEFKPSVVVAMEDPANWREVDPENLIIFETTKGRILIEAFPEIAPIHATQFRTIVRSGDYDGTPFHRVIDGFMAQGGNVLAHHGRDTGLPNLQAEFDFRRNPAEMKLDFIGGSETGSQGYYNGLPINTQTSWFAELSHDGRVASNIPHCAGIVSTARVDGDVNSGNSQFFLMRGHTPNLDHQYSPWGRIVDGEKIPVEMKVGDPQVVDPDILTSARLAADIALDKRPRVWVQRTDGPLFEAEIADADRGDICARPSVPSIVHN